MKKVLIVDDQQEVREIVKVTLMSDDFMILEAASGAVALEIVKKEKPDLILMDVMMPGEIDGIKAARIIKSDIETKNCKIIILTAKGQAFDKQMGYDAGADEYFTKPFSPLDLIKKVDQILTAD